MGRQVNMCNVRVNEPRASGLEIHVGIADVGFLPAGLASVP